MDALELFSLKSFFDEDICEDVNLSQADRFIFWIGGGIAIITTFFLVLGSIRFKELRKQPGDLIVGIALSDFTLCIHWITLATFYKQTNHSHANDVFCSVVGGIGAFAGLTEFCYNVAFNFFLIISLKNALKQDKIPKKSFHFVILLFASAFIGFLYSQNRIGKTQAGTCSIKTNCSPNLFSYFAPAIVLSYAFVGLYIYHYIRKNAPRCAQAHKKRTAFLLYYLRYIKASIVVYGIIAFTSILSIAMTGSEAAGVVNSMYNIAKLCSPLVISIIRYNDPLIKKTMKKTILFWRSDPINSTVNDPLLKKTEEELKGSVNGIEEGIRKEIEEHEDAGEEFVFNELSSNLKVEITYTLLSCILYADFSQRNSLWESKAKTVIDKKIHDPYKHERMYMIGEGATKYLLPSVKKELERTKFTVMPGTLKVYSPLIFTQFLDDDKQFLDLQESLDFSKNREQIKDASGAGGGKSGEFFFFSRDKKLIIKTVPDVEIKRISSILERYEHHLRENPNSLIAKIYGAFTFQSTEYGQKFNLIVMKNINGFPSKYVERVYDMKGSRYDREVLKAKTNLDKAALKNEGVLKDLDFERFENKLFIREDLKQQFIRQMEADSLFFRRVKLIDYSFMVFCVNKEQYVKDNGSLQDSFTAKNYLASLANTQEPGMYYNVGIVDYLQPYNLQKAMEKIFKRIKKRDLNLDTSSQDPEYYSKRFIAFMKKIVE